MIIGNVNGEIQNLEQVVYDSGELTVGTTTLSITGLDGNSAEEMTLITRIIQGDDGSPTYYARLNGTAAGYGYQFIKGVNNAASANTLTNATGLIIAGTTSSTNSQLTKMSLYTKSDFERSSISYNCANVSGKNTGEISAYAQSFKDSTTNITSMDVTSTVANSIGGGSRIVLLEKKDQPNDMQTGSLKVKGTVSNAWQKIYETELTAAATAVTISGVDGDSDVFWNLKVRGVQNGAGLPTWYTRPNNYTGAIYGFQMIRGIGAAVVAARNSASTGFITGATTATNECVLNDQLIYAKSGYERLSISKEVSSVVGTNVGELRVDGCSWANSSTNITSLVVTTSVANIMGSGTNIELWRLNL